MFGIIFVWQLPHFLAIAWKYRDQYRQAGCPLWTDGDTDGRATGRRIVGYTVVLLAITLSPWYVGLTSDASLPIVLLLGAGFLIPAIGFGVRRSNLWAQRVFFGSLLYLPALFMILAVCKTSG